MEPLLLVESLLDLVVRTVTDVDVTEEPAIGGVVVTGLLASLLWTDEETALPIFPVSVLCCVVTVVVSKTEEGKVVGSLESSPCKEFPGNNDSSGQLVIVVVPVWTEVCVRCSVNTPSTHGSIPERKTCVAVPKTPHKFIDCLLFFAVTINKKVW